MPRALALFAMLTKAGYAPVFVSEIRRVGPDLRGHAWVLVKGEPVETDAARIMSTDYREQFRYEGGTAI